MVQQSVSERGHKQVTAGAVDIYGVPFDVATMELVGIISGKGDLEPKAMSGDRGDVLEFNVICGRKGGGSWKVSLFGALATLTGLMVKRGMRVSVQGRPRQRVFGNMGREQVEVSLIGYEIGIWDEQHQIHWLQYDRGQAVVYEPVVNDLQQ